MNRTALRTRRGWRVAAALGATIALASVPAIAYAATLNVTYDATGVSHVAKTNSDITLGPTTLKVALESTSGAFTGHLSIPSARTQFNALGFLPTAATVDFIEAAPVTGSLNRVGTISTVTSTASYYIKLSNIKVLGFPTFAGDHCKTKQPVSIPASTPPGEVFSITGGGTLAGTFTIGDFEHCGLNTPLINALIPGGGNTVNLTVNHGRIG